MAFLPFRMSSHSYPPAHENTASAIGSGRFEVYPNPTTVSRNAHECFVGMEGTNNRDFQTIELNSEVARESFKTFRALVVMLNVACFLKG